MLLFSSETFFSNLLFSKSSMGTLSVPNSLDPDQDRLSVGPDPGRNCL